MAAYPQPARYSVVDEVWRAIEHDAERALRDLPTAEMQVLRLRFGIGTRRRSQRDIAQRLGVSISTVRRLERRALRALSLPSDLPRRPTATHSVGQPRDTVPHVEAAPHH